MAARKRTPKEPAEPPEPVGVVCDEALISEVEQNVQVGVPPQTAVLAAGATEAQFSDWMKRAQRPAEDGSDQPYVDLADAIRRAEARCEAIIIARIRKASTVSWQAAAWLAERRFPDRYVRRSVNERDAQQSGEPQTIDEFADIDDVDDNVVDIRGRARER